MLRRISPKNMEELRALPVGLRGRMRVELEVRVAIPLRKGQGKVNQIKVEGKYEKEKEAIVHHGIGSPKLKTWNHDFFLRDWQKNIRSRKEK
jgi:hypothetical protein